MIATTRALIGLGLLVVLGATGGTSAATPAWAAAAGTAQTGDLLYVCVQDDAKIAVVDMAAQKVVRTIDLTALGFTATAKPHFIAVEPDGAHWYVSLIGANRVVKFDRENRMVGQFEMETPGMIAIAGDAQLAVSRSMSAVNPPKRIGLIDRRAMTGEEVDILFPRPHPMAVAGGYAYTASLGVNQIASIALADQKVQVVDVPGPPHAFVQFAVSPDRRTLVASSEVSGQLLVFDLAEPARPALRQAVPIGKMAFDPVFTPDGRQVWVPVKMANQIAVVDTTTWSVTMRIEDPALQQPHQVVFSPDGRTAFVTNNNKMDHMADPAHAGHAMPASGSGEASLVVIDVASRQVQKALPLGKNLTGMGRKGY